MTDNNNFFDPRLKNMPEPEKPPIMSTMTEDEEKGYDRKALKLRGTKLFALAFSTLGIIYSDIGESYTITGTSSLFRNEAKLTRIDQVHHLCTC